MSPSTTAETPTFRLQARQREFATSASDIAVYGGAAGGGKSFALLYQPIGRRHHQRPGFYGVIFRRSYPEITNPGGLWDAAGGIYPYAGGQGVVGSREYRFPGGSRIAFRHLENEDTKHSYQGTEICYLAFDELTHFCYNAVMETLTEGGWKRIADVVPGERVMALTPEGMARYEQVTAAWGFDYAGEMHETTNRSIRYSVTPNHKMVIRRQGYEGWQFCEAKDLDRFPRFPFDSEWHGEEREWVDLPPPSGRGIGPNANRVDRVRADDYLELLGWYLAEGSSFIAGRPRGTSSPCVSIRQTKPCESLHRLMARLPFRSRWRDGDGYRIFSRQLYDHLKPLGDLYVKRVPRWIMGLSRRQLRLFFDAFTLGDGHCRGNGAIAFGLANEGLVDDLQEIAAKLGRRSTKAVGRGGEGNAYVTHRLYVHAREGGLVQDRPENKRLVPYEGKVYCITVEPSHTLLVRHEGRVSWSGNSESQFWYMLSRNRSTCGVRPYVRATCNPDPGWVKDLLAPWVDDGFDGPKALSGELRWFVRLEGKIRWVERDHPDAKSLTFIRASIYDNAVLLDRNPEYLATLKALPPVERARLLDGDWSIRREGLVYPGFDGCIVDALPAHLGAPDGGGIDFGFHNPFAAVWGVVDHDDVMWVLGCRSVRQTTIPTHAEAIPRGPRWWCDPAQPESIAQLRAHGHDALPCVHRPVRGASGEMKKPVLAGIDMVSQRIRGGRLKIYRPMCLPLIRSLSLYHYDETKQSEDPVKEDDHEADALRYWTVGIDRNRSVPGVVESDAERLARQSKEAEELKAAAAERDRAAQEDPDSPRWWS